jgi:hypothetical protein
VLLESVFNITSGIHTPAENSYILTRGFSSVRFAAQGVAYTLVGGANDRENRNSLAPHPPRINEILHFYRKKLI